MEKSHRFGKLQFRIMRLLWKGRCNAREITEGLNREKGEDPVAHSTVQTLLRQLEEKGAVAHEVRERTFIFHPLVREENTLRKTTRDLLERLFDGSAVGLISHLLKSEKISPKEMAEIRRLIEGKEGKQ